MQLCMLRSVKILSLLGASLNLSSCELLSDSCDTVHLVQQRMFFLPMRSTFCAILKTDGFTCRAGLNDERQYILKGPGWCSDKLVL